jgi:hypothetical protein
MPDPQNNPAFPTAQTVPGVGQPGTLGGYKANPRFTSGTKNYEGKVGDRFLDVPTGPAGGEDTLRPGYGMEKAENVIPNEKEQLASDIRFDMFDTVNPGFGNGSDNKLFIMEQNRDKKIIYAEPTFKPGSYNGPIAGVTVPPWQLQRVMPTAKVQAYGRDRKNKLNTVTDVVLDYGRSSKSTNILGDDVGYPYSHSACELKRNRLSPFEPVIRTDMCWEHVKDPIGAELNKKRFRSEIDSQRYPRHLDSRSAGMGGQHLSKRRALEVILN